MRKLALLLVVLLLAACSDDDVSGPEIDEISGTYTLETINGQPLPYAIIQIGNIYITAYIGGSMTLNPNHRYVERADLRTAFYDSVGAVVVEDTTVELHGTWEVEDSAIWLTPEVDPNILFGLVARSTLTLSVESSNDSTTTYFYRKNENGSGVAGRPHITYRSSSSVGSESRSLSLSLSGSMTRLLTTTSSTTGLRSTTTSSILSSARKSSAERASSGRSSP